MEKEERNLILEHQEVVSQESEVPVDDMSLSLLIIEVPFDQELNDERSVDDQLHSIKGSCLTRLVQSIASSLGA